MASIYGKSLPQRFPECRFVFSESIRIKGVVNKGAMPRTANQTSLP